MKPALNALIAGRTSKEASADYYRKNIETVKARHHKYREENREEVRECNRKSYYKNIDKRLTKMREKAECSICGKELVKRYLNKHIKNQH